MLTRQLARTLKTAIPNGKLYNNLALKTLSAVHLSPKFQNIRYLSTESKPTEPPADAQDGAKQTNSVMKMDYDEYDDYEPKNSAEWTAYWGSIILRLSLLGAGAVCIFFTIRELFPGRMSSNSLFSEAFDKLKDNHQVLEVTGDSPMAFGRDVGRNTEGRRNHIDSYKYVGIDGSNRLRIRFNIKGPKGQVRVWTEVSDKMGPDQYVYLIYQNVRTGRVTTVVDDRDVVDVEPSSSVPKDFFANFTLMK